MSKYLEDEQFQKFMLKSKKRDCQDKCCKCCDVMEKKLDYMMELLEQLFLKIKN